MRLRKSGGSEAIAHEGRWRRLIKSDMVANILNRVPFIFAY